MRWLEGLLSLRQDELVKALPFLVLLVCLFGGVTVARNLAMSFVVADFGKEALPWLFALIGGFQLLFALAYAVLSAQFGTRRLYSGLLVALAVFCVACMGLLWLDVRLASALLYVGLFVLLPVILIHDGTHLATYLNPHEQKKLAGFIAAGIPLGAMLGGALLVLLLRWVPPVLLLFALPLSAVLTIWMVLRIARRRVSFDGDAYPNDSVDPVRQMQAGVRAATKVPLIKWLAAGVFVATLVQQLMVYFYQGIIYPTEFPDVAQRAAFFGKYDFFMNFAALLFQLLLASRLISRLGVGVSSALHPILYLGSALLLAASQGLLAGVVSQAVNQELRTYFRKPVDNLLFNGLSSQLWGISKAFLGGVVQPLAILFSTLLLLMLQGLPVALMLPLLQGLLILCALVGVALVVPQARAYDAGVLDLLKKRGLPHDQVRQLPPDMVAAQARVLLLSQHTDEVLLGLELLRQIRRPSDLPAILQLLHRTADPMVVAACIEHLADFPEDYDAFAALKWLFQRGRADANEGLLQQTLSSLERFDRPEMAAEVSVLLHDSTLSMATVARAALYLCVSAHASDDAVLRQLAQSILVRGDATLRAQALEIMAYLTHPNDVPQLTPLLTDKAGAVRAAALRCMATIPPACWLTPTRLQQALQDRQSPVRLAAVKLLQQYPDVMTEGPATVLPLLADPAPRVVKAVRELLAAQLPHWGESLMQALYDLNTPFTQRAELLTILEPLRDDAFDQRLKQACRQALSRVLYGSNLGPRIQAEVGGALGDFVQKHVKHLMADALQFAVLAVVKLARQEDELAQRISRGLLSTSVREQGLALEALSRLPQRELAGWVVRVAEVRTMPLSRRDPLYRELTGKPLPQRVALWQQLELLGGTYLRAAAWLMHRDDMPSDPEVRRLLVAT